MKSEPDPSSAANGTCPQCGAAFRCGMVGDDGQCWCAALPPLAALPASGGDPAACLCPACLRLRLAGEAAANVGAGDTAA